MSQSIILNSARPTSPGWFALIASTLPTSKGPSQVLGSQRIPAHERQCENTASPGIFDSISENGLTQSTNCDKILR